MKRLLISVIVAITALLPVTAIAQPAAPPVVYSIYSDPYAMRGISWDSVIEDVAAAEGGKISKETVTVKSGVDLYGNAATSLIYEFKNGRMASRKFTLKSTKAYSTVFYGLFYYYGVPVFWNKRNYTWELPDMQIKLLYGSRIQVVFTLRENEE